MNNKLVASIRAYIKKWGSMDRGQKFAQIWVGFTFVWMVFSAWLLIDYLLWLLNN